MPDKFFLRSCCAAAFTVALLFSSAAFAGFEWVPQTDAGAAPMSAPADAYAPATSMPEIISPVIISGDAQSSSSMPAPVIITGDAHPAPSLSSYSAPTSAPIALSAPSSVTPAASVTIPVTPPDAVILSTASAPLPAPAPAPLPRHADLATATIAMPASGGDVVQGFASQIPLPLALRQLLPVGYNFSIDPGVDMDTLVSYKGGKSWRDTLHDMLAADGLVGREQGNTITVTPAAVAASAAPTAAPAPVLSPLPEKSIGQLSLVSSAPASRPMDMSGNAAPPEGWSVERGDTLRKALTAWCQRAGVELQWIAEYDYPVEASAHFNGSFQDAVRNLLSGFNGAQPQPIGELHTNPNAGQMVLVVQARGNNYSN